MRTLKLTIAYDGTNYHGWQSQPGGLPTVQQAIETALARITGAEIRVVGSGRTDAGVHALGQVVSFSTTSVLPADSFRRALNQLLPADIAVHEAVDVAPGFHAIYDALRKRYRYVILDSRQRAAFNRNYYHHVWTPLDAAAMHAAGQQLVGKHDFRCFQSVKSVRRSTVRTIFDLEVRRGAGGLPSAEGVDYLLIEVEADGFLYNMVRSIAGTLLEVGRGFRPIPWVGEVLASGDRSRAGMTLPPEGLYLLRVDYPPASPA